MKRTLTLFSLLTLYFSSPLLADTPAVETLEPIIGEIKTTIEDQTKAIKTMTAATEVQTLQTRIEDASADPAKVKKFQAELDQSLAQLFTAITATTTQQKEVQEKQAPLQEELY